MSTFTQYPGDGSNRIFSVPFPYLNPTHVKVSINGILQVNGADYDFTGASTIQFREYRVPVAGTVVEVRRETPVDNLLVIFQNSAVLTAEDLNVATRQLFNLAQEVRDIHNARIEAGISRLSTGDYTNASDMIDAITQDILESDLVAELNSRITDIDTNAESILQQTARLDEIQNVVDTLLEIDGVGIATYVQNVEQTMIDGDEALAARIALIGAESGGGTAFILDLDTVMVSPIQSLATKFTLIEAGIDTNADGVADNAAAISTEATARASGDSANASSITTLSSTVGGHTSSLATISSVQAGLSAQYMVKTDVNGFVSGFGLYNTGASSDFIVLANKFAVVTPGNTPTVPFAVVGGVVFMQNVVIDGALIDNLTVGTIKIASGAITNAALGSNNSSTVIPAFNAWTGITLATATTVAGSKLVAWGGVTLKGLPTDAVVTTRIRRSTDSAIIGGGQRWEVALNTGVGQCNLTVFGVDTNTLAGSTTYRLEYFVTTAGSAGTAAESRGDLILLETKR